MTTYYRAHEPQHHSGCHIFATKTRNHEESPWVHSSCVLRVFVTSWLHSLVGREARWVGWVQEVWGGGECHSTCLVRSRVHRVRLAFRAPRRGGRPGRDHRARRGRPRPHVCHRDADDG